MPPIVEETIEVLPRSIAAVDAVPAHVDEFIAEVPVATFDELRKILT